MKKFNIDELSDIMNDCILDKKICNNDIYNVQINNKSNIKNGPNDTNNDELNIKDEENNVLFKLDDLDNDELKDLARELFCNEKIKRKYTRKTNQMN